VKNLLSILIFTVLFFTLSPTIYAQFQPSCIAENNTGCYGDVLTNRQGNCCLGLVCNGKPDTSGEIANGTCTKATAPPQINPSPKPAGSCFPNNTGCITDDQCCSKLCALFPDNAASGQAVYKCTDVAPTWPAGCAAPNEACSEDSNCCYGSCIEQGGAKICMEGAPTSKNPPPCSEWQDGKCIRIASGLGIDIPTDVPGIIKTFFGIILSISGATATLLFIYAGYKIMAARGNPEKFQEAKDRFTSTILGLLFIILSLVILQVIGVDLLKIPGFSQ